MSTQNAQSKLVLKKETLIDINGGVIVIGETPCSGTIKPLPRRMKENKAWKNVVLDLKLFSF